MGTFGADFVSVSGCQSCSGADVNEIKPPQLSYHHRRVRRGESLTANFPFQQLKTTFLGFYEN